MSSPPIYRAVRAARLAPAQALRALSRAHRHHELVAKRGRGWRVVWGAVRRPLGGISTAVLIAVVVTELLSSSAAGAAEHHPATAALLTTFVALAFTASIIDEVGRQRDEFSWKRVRDITLKGLNDELRASRDVLWVAMTGKVPYGTTDPDIDRALRRAGQARNATAAVADTAGEFVERLAKDGSLSEFTPEVLHIATQRMRAGLGRWAPLTVRAKGDYRILSMMAVVADLFEALEYPMTRGRLCRDGIVAPRYREPLIAVWRTTLAGIVYVEEEVVRALEQQEPRWESVARDLLPSEELQQVLAWLAGTGSFETEALSRRDSLALEIGPNR